MKGLVEKLAREHDLSDAELLCLVEAPEGEATRLLEQRARAACDAVYGRTVFLRGLIEVSNHCKNNCLYCGIRRDNSRAPRYRLGEEEILACCGAGYAAGLRTFVLQGGEDPWFTDDRLCGIVARIRENHPDCAVTLSMGERTAKSYRRLYDAGAARYLLRHETADPGHYARLHPAEMSFQRRMECLAELKETGFQVGCGFMVGSPGQTAEHIVRDLRFIKTFRPHMVGIGPFIPHCDTPFADEPPGSTVLTCRLLAIVRLLLPDVLLPATTALGTLSEVARLRGIGAGANVIMPNLSPPAAREKYTLYDGKKHSGGESAEGVRRLREQLAALGYSAPPLRGDCVRYETNATDGKDPSDPEERMIQNV